MKDEIKHELDAIKVMVSQLHKLSFGSLKSDPDVKLRHKFRADILSMGNKKPRSGG